MKLRACSVHMLTELQIETSTPIRAVHAKFLMGQCVEGFNSKNKPRLVLIRGVSGSGKSTLAGEFLKAGFRHFEADRYFIKDGVWMLDKTKIPEAQTWCRNLVARTLDFGQSAVVSNTFPRLQDLSKYLKLTQSALVVETAGTWPNIHGVTIEEIQKMSRRWEAL